MVVKSNYLKGHDNFRLKLALSLITLKPVRIAEIRSRNTDPGVDEAEICCLKLIDEISNGTVSKINDTGNYCVPHPFIHPWYTKVQWSPSVQEP